VEDRLYQVYGERPDLLPVHRETGGIAIRGFVAALAETGPTRGPQNVFINRRIVRDRTIAHAILDAYSVASNRERSPEVHLFLEIPPDRLDVNVHPTKAEVRFREQSLVHEVVKRAIGDALMTGGIPELQLRPSDLMPGQPETPSIPGMLSGAWGARGAWSATGAVPIPDALAHGTEPVTPVEPVAPVAPGHRPLIPLGQFRNTFIIAIDDEGICIIDQHVAHERVLFERIMERLTASALESQRMLVPLLLDLAPAERAALLSRANELSSFGFEIEEFGGETTLKVTAVPALLPRDECATALRALAQDFEGLDRGLDLREALKRIAATTACHAAVKANDSLTEEKMRHILEELRATSYSTVCPHGRPVMLRITRREVEKNFERI
jgi:DNA mismatch repair protein MutL